MLKREWGAESNEKLPHLFIPVNVQPWFLSVRLKACLWAELRPLVPQFVVNDLPLGRILWWWWWWSHISYSIIIVLVLAYLQSIKKDNKSVALQLRRAKTDGSGCCQMAAQEALWLGKRYPSILISVLLTGFRYFSYKAATQLASRGWVDPVPDPILLEKFLVYSRESNPGPLGWQSDVLTTIPNRRSTCNPYNIIL